MLATSRELVHIPEVIRTLLFTHTLGLGRLGG